MAMPGAAIVCLRGDLAGHFRLARGQPGRKFFGASPENSLGMVPQTGQTTASASTPLRYLETVDGAMSKATANKACTPRRCRQRAYQYTTFARRSATSRRLTAFSRRRAPARWCAPTVEIGVLHVPMLPSSKGSFPTYWNDATSPLAHLSRVNVRTYGPPLAVENLAHF
jgi:hypothetical protein